MKTVISIQNKLTLISIITFFSLLFCICPDLYAQGDKGQITNWYLEGTPHGPNQLESRDAGIRWDVKYINATGGHIQAKLWSQKNTECYSMADYKWSFSKDVTNVAQDERVIINFSVSAQDGQPKCGMYAPPLDPIMDFRVFGSITPRKDLIGSITEEGRQYLFKYEQAPGGNIRVSMRTRVLNVPVIVEDRSPTGSDQDARDGGFGFWLSWRGLNYDVYYKYAAGSTDPVTEQGSTTRTEDEQTTSEDEAISTDDVLIADIEGEWRGIFPERNWDKTGYYINQNGDAITLSYPADGTSATGIISGNVINLTGGDWGRGTGNISQGGRRIDFDNGSYWIKLTTPGTWRPSGNQDCEGNGIYMYAENRTGPSGKTIELPVFICNVDDLANMDVALRWQNKVAQLVDVKKGAATKNISFQWNEVTKGYLKIAFAASRGFSGSASIAVLVFRLVGSEGDETPVTGDVTTANYSSGANIDIKAFTPGKITISKSSVPGDCDGDQKLTERDALAALQIAVEKRPFDKCYDVNNDGNVNSQDARIILRKIVGLGT